MGYSSIASKEHQPPLTSVPFQLGPILVFDKPLTKGTSGLHIYHWSKFELKAPSHISSVRDAPLQDHITSISAELIHRLGACWNG